MTMKAYRKGKHALVEEIALQCDVAPDAIEDAYPCTPFQRDSYAATVGSPYVLYSHMIYRLDQHLADDAERLKSAIAQIHTQNPLLRTRIVRLRDGSGMPGRFVQAVIRESLDWTVFDDLDIHCSKRQGLILEYGDRLVHFAMSRDRRTLVLGMHHAVYDAWSVRLIWQDIRIAFHARKSPLLTNRPSFSRFIASLQRPILLAASHFWSEHYKDYQGPCFPKGQILPHTNFRRTGSAPILRSPGSEVTMTARVHAAWACTLLELFQCEDVAYASTAMGRNGPVADVLEIAGPTVCHVPFRARGRRDTALRELLYVLQDQARKGSEYEHAAGDVFHSMVDEARWPAFELNVFTSSNAIKPLEGMTPHPVEGQILRHTWEGRMVVEVGERDFSWEFSGDMARVPPHQVKQVCRRFPEILRDVPLCETRAETRLADVIDLP